MYHEIWFMSDIGLDCDLIKADSFKQAEAIALKAYGDSLVDVSLDCDLIKADSSKQIVKSGQSKGEL